MGDWGNWKKFLNADPVDWLLEEDHPTVRYLTLTEILDMPTEDRNVKQAKRGIMKAGAVPRILAKQEKEGYWDLPDKFYTAKYRGTVWQLIILAELLADANEERIRRGCEFILNNSQDLESGGFSVHHSIKKGGGRHSEVIPCLTGNMVWSLIRLGYLDDPRIQRGIDWITTYQRFDDRIEQAPQGWPYQKAEPCWGKHTCHMGIVKALKALSEIPEEVRSAKVNKTLKYGVEYLLKHHIYKRSSDLSLVSKPGWQRFGFPLMYQTDVLEILGILIKLDCRDERMQEAVDLVISKEDSTGRWKLESTFNGRFQVNIEVKGKPSKWITLQALRTLKRYYG